MSLTNALAGQKKEVMAAPEPFASLSREAERPANKTSWRELIPRSLTEILLLGVVVLVISQHLKYFLDVRTAMPNQDDWNLLDKMFRAFDVHRVGSWVFDSPNGHFLVPAALAYLFSFHYLSLDLAPLRFLNFPICLVAFCLTAHVINAGIRSRFLRFYLYTGASFIVFNLCLWEHFALGCGFSAVLAALFGGIGLYYVAKATQTSGIWNKDLLVGLVFLIGSVLSLGSGYAAVAAAGLLLALSRLKTPLVSQPMPRYQTVVYWLAWALGLLAIASHPLFHLKSRVTKAVLHVVLVAGSAGSTYLDKSTLLAQNIAFIGGVLVIVISLSTGYHFLTTPRSRNRLLSTFSVALILFGLFGCIAVTVVRSYLPNGEFLNSRYALYPCLCLLGILLYLGCSKIFLLTHVWCFLAAGFLLASVREHQIGFYRPQLYAAMERAINRIDTLSDEQLRAALYWRDNTRGVRRVVTRMRRDRLNVFRGSPAPTNGLSLPKAPEREPTPSPGPL